MTQGRKAKVTNFNQRKNVSTVPASRNIFFNQKSITNGTFQQGEGILAYCG